MNEKNLKPYVIFIFFIIFLFTFPFYYLKDTILGYVNKASGGHIQISAQDLSFGFSGLALKNVTASTPNAVFQMDAISVLPSLKSLMNLALGISISIDGFYGSDVHMHLGKRIKGFYLAVSSDDFNFEKCEPLRLVIPSVQGSMDVDGSFSLDSLQPMRGTGSMAVDSKKITIDKPFSIAGFSIPAVKTLTPGIKGKLTLEGSKLLLHKITIGANGQNLFTTIDGSITMSNDLMNSPMDLSITLALGNELKEDVLVRSLWNIDLIKPFKKDETTAAVKLTGTMNAPVPAPL